MAAAIAVLLPLAFAVPAHASNDVLDQSQMLTISLQRQVAMMAQTFTAGSSGSIDRVSLASDTTSGFANVRVTIHTLASNGAPSGTAVGPTSAFSGAVLCCRQFHDYSFNPAIQVSAGARYAVVVEVLAGVFTWYDSGSFDAYAGGRQYIACAGCAWITTSHSDFAFKTWVLNNTAPTITVDRSTVSVPEGTAPVNTGTYSDPDGDAVAVSASTGTLTKTGTSGGTWSWTQPAADEAATQTVVITADDAQGFTMTTSFTLDVTPVAPTATILTDPLTVPEGSPVPFTGGATTPSSLDAATVKYTWTVAKNGNAYTTGSGTAFSFTPDDDGGYLVTFTVSDDSGLSGSTSMTVTATNVAPNAAINSVTPSVQLVTAAGESMTFRGSFTDVDTTDSYAITWNFGDGTTATGATVTHTYGTAGTYPVTFQVADGEGGVGRATTSVRVQTTQQALTSIAGFVQSRPGLTAGQRNSLLAKLNAASDAAARGNTTAAHNELNAFLNELQADVSSGKISSADAGILRSAVHAVQGSIGTYNRFLEWWPLEA